MKKLIILGVFGLVFLCPGRQAFADDWHYRRNDDVDAFRKVIHVLDAIVNNDHRRPQRVVVYRDRHHPRKTCFYKRHHKFCKSNWRGHRKYGRGHQHWPNYVKTCRVRH